jgi:hypothetical protein
MAEVRPAGIPTVREIVLHQAGYLVVPTPGAPNGAVVRLAFPCPNGDTYVIPLDDAAAKQIGSALLAPRVALPGQQNGHGGG